MSIFKYIVVVLLGKWGLLILGGLVCIFILWIGIGSIIDYHTEKNLSEAERENKQIANIIKENTGLKFKQVKMLNHEAEYLGISDSIHYFEVEINEEFDESKLLVNIDSEKKHFSVSKLEMPKRFSHTH